MAFWLYILYVVSNLIHLPAMIPALGLIRFDLILILAVIVAAFFSGRSKTPGALPDKGRREDRQRTGRVTDGRKNPPPFVGVYRTVTSLRYWRGSVLINGIPELAKGLVFDYFTRRLIKNEKQMRIFLIVFIACQSFRVFLSCLPSCHTRILG